jgi:hypothetical protein
MVSRRRVGTWLVAVSVGVVVVSLVVGALLAPPVSEATGPESADHDYLVGSQGKGVVERFDADGSPTWNTSALDPPTYTRDYFDADRIPDNRIFVPFTTTKDHDCGPYTSPCPHAGVRIIDPADDEIDYEWSYPVRTDRDSEIHDADLLPSGEILVVGMEHERVFTLDPDTDEITWQWNASRRYDPPPDPTKRDWLHMNDVDRIGPGRYLVSVRNANQLLVIERGQGVVDVINEEGDPSLMKHQHNPQWLGSGSVLVADSGNDRVVELHEQDGEWVVGWQLTEAGGVALDWPRDADRLPDGHTLVTDTNTDRVVEVDRRGEVVWQKTIRGPYDAERLPPGEQPTGPVLSGPDAEDTGPPFRLPGISYLLDSATYATPVPYWVNQWHALLAMLATVGCVVGLALRRSGP